jgi:hypothetical protein
MNFQWFVMPIAVEMRIFVCVSHRFLQGYKDRLAVRTGVADLPCLSGLHPGKKIVSVWRIKFS